MTLNHNGAVQQMRTQLWQKLGSVFQKYAGANHEIATSKIEQIIHDVLGEQSPQEVDYVLKNMFRLDSDSSGSVSLEEFGNFLFKRHCGEMSLQKMHMQNQISHGAQRKIDEKEFHALIIKAYKFLDVTVHPEITQYIFKSSDSDQDGFITYVEYFKVINDYVCKSQKKQKKVQKTIQTSGKQRNSRLRTHMWIQLRKLYESYIHGRNLPANDNQLRAFISSIAGDLSQSQMNFILTDLFKRNMKFFEFDPFATVFLHLIAELRLSRYSRYNNITQKILSKDQFNVLFKNTYQFLALGRMKLSFLDKLYLIIDQNHDGMVTYEEYLNWVRRFVAVQKYFGDQFYFKEDDLDLQPSEDYLFQPDRKPVENKRIAQKISFKFKDHSLAYALRQRMFSLLIEFDANHDHLFDQTQIESALIKLLKEDTNELKYVTANVFRYDRDGDRNVTYEELTNFCVEQHFAEMAIQRIHRKGGYSRGKQRIMNEEQFGFTLNYCLEFLQLSASKEIIKHLFEEIDLDHDGWISYEVYFFFLKYYFGSLSFASQNPNFKIEHKAGTLAQDLHLISRVSNLEVIERFVKLIMEQLSEICGRYDVNKNMAYQTEEIEAILTEVFHLSSTEIDYIMYNYFRFDIRSQQFTTYNEFIAIALEIYFIQILFNRKYQQNPQLQKNTQISIREFINLLFDNLFFIKVRPSKQDLLTIFEILDTDKDGFISFQQYINLIREYLGRGLEIVDKPIKQEQLKPEPAVEGVSEVEVKFVELIWGELKKYFDNYDQGHKGYLQESELKSFAVEVLNESSERELDYIFWNLFRVDGNYNKEVDFEQFAPFILKHAGQISLQRFHKEQLKGNSTLNEDQLYAVLNGAYSFLVSMPKNKTSCSTIFQRISQNGTIAYGKFLAWVNAALVKRFR